MAGSRRRRRPRRDVRAGSPHQSAEPSPPAEATLSSREAAAVERSSKNICRASTSTSSPVVLPPLPPRLCLDLMFVQISWTTCFMKLLLSSTHSITSLLSSAPAILGALQSLQFPLCIPLASHHSTSNQMVLMLVQIATVSSPTLLSNWKWQLSDPSKKNSSLACSVPQNTPDTMQYLGYSYGYLIFSYVEHCLLVDVYNGTKVKPPKLPPNNKFWCFYGIGVLTAPLNSPNSRLLLCSKSSMLEWQVGTDYWSEHPLALGHENIRQIVVFKGDIFVINYLMRIHTVHFTPQFSVQEAEIMWESFFAINPWLVSCGDMLLMVDLSVSSFDWHGTYSHTFDVFRLDLVVEPAKFVKMEKLENYALFVSLDKRNPTFCCMSPERWGGKSNCIYAAKLLEDPDESWIAVELGQPVQEKTVQYLFYGHAFPPDHSLLSSLWVFPSLIYGSG